MTQSTPPPSWNQTTIGGCLADEFPGDWGSEPGPGGPNAYILRSTNLDENGHINFATAAARWIDEQHLSKRRLQDGDVLLEASGGGPGKPVGRVAHFQAPDSLTYLSSNFFRTLRSDETKVVPRFLAWRLLELYRQPKIWNFQQQTTGIINLKTKDYLRQPLWLPEKPEQSRIVAVLDTLDETIAKTEAVIAKLRKVRIGLLHDLLTYGLGHDGQLRDPVAHPEQFTNSPLGLIPHEWEIRRLDELIASAVDGPFGSHLKTQHYVNQPGVRVVRLQNIESGGFVDSDKAYVSVHHAATLTRHETLPGDLLVASMGDENHPLARACLYPDDFAPGIVKADCFRLRMKPEQAVNGYVMHFMNCPSTRRDINLFGQGVTRDRVNLTTLLTVRVARPPIEEQKEIVKRVKALDLSLSSELHTYSKLVLVKSGLMTDLLTGRVRVPEPIGITR